ncbi:hypothetical protein LEMLEM_LOCUS18791, partial [Lemmus lemmus]
GKPGKDWTPRAASTDSSRRRRKIRVGVLGDRRKCQIPSPGD